MNLRIPENLEKVRNIQIKKDELINFETDIAKQYEDGNIGSPIHLSKNNEDDLIEIFQYVSTDDWVFSGWRNHYHALLVEYGEYYETK